MAKGAPHPYDSSHSTDLALPQVSCAISLRLLCLRVVIPSAIALCVLSCRMVNGEWHSEKLWISGFFMSLFTAIHHTWTVVGPGLFPVPVWFDIVWTLIEAVFFVLFAYFVNVVNPNAGFGGATQANDDQQQTGELTPTANQPPPPLSPRDTIQVYARIAECTLTVCLIGLFLVKVAVATNDRRSCPMSKRVNVVGLPPSPWWKYALYGIFGRRLLREAVPGESKWLVLIRGILSISAIFVLLSFAVAQAVLAPLNEMAKTPKQQYRSRRLPDGMGPNLGLISPQWKVILVWPATSKAENKNLGNIITAHMVLPPNRAPTEECSCEVEIGGTLDGKNARHEVAIIHCDSITLPGAGPDNGSPSQLVDFQRDWFINFRVGVNYSESLSPQLNTDTNYTRLREAVRAYLAIGHVDIGVVVEETDPVMLFPGLHLLSFATVNIRQRLKGATLANLGFETLETYPIVEIKQTTPNPIATNDPTTSTLSFLLLSKTGSWTIVQEYRAKSVLSALSSIGGLGSLFSTLLVVLLGTSLLGALFHTKPYSPFGLLHSISPLQRRMVKRCDVLYPGMRRDLQRFGVEPGVVAYIIDTYIDMDALGRYTDDDLESGRVNEPTPPSTLADYAHVNVEEKEEPGVDDREWTPKGYHVDVEGKNWAESDESVAVTRGSCDTDHAISELSRDRPTP